MEPALERRPWRTLAIGGLGALALGLLGGAALRPQLDLDRPTGPQTLIAAGGPRAVNPGTVAPARAPGQLPDYVVGTDWLRAHAAQASSPPTAHEFAAERVETVVYASREDLGPSPAAEPAWRHEPPAPTLYPSERGGVAYEANRPLPPAPPESDDWDDALEDDLD